MGNTLLLILLLLLIRLLLDQSYLCRMECTLDLGSLGQVYWKLFKNCIVYSIASFKNMNLHVGLKKLNVISPLNSLSMEGGDHADHVKVSKRKSNGWQDYEL